MNVKIGGKIVPVGQVYDKSLFATRPIKLYRRPDSTQVVYSVQSGEHVGIVYSHVMDGLSLWWMFYDKYGKPYYARHEENAFSWSALQQQGTQTAEEIVKENKPKTPLDSIIEGVGTIVKPAVIAIALYYAAKALTEQK